MVDSEPNLQTCGVTSIERHTVFVVVLHGMELSAIIYFSRQDVSQPVERSSRELYILQ